MTIEESVKEFKQAVFELFRIPQIVKAIERLVGDTE